MERILRMLNGRLRSKLIVVFSLIVALIVILLSYLSYRQSSLMNEENFIASNQKIMKLVNQNLDNYISKIDEFTLSPRKDSVFMDAIISNEYLAQFNIQNQIKNMFYSREDIEEITIYTPINHTQYRLSRSTVNLTQQSDYQTEQEAWYKEAAGSPKFRSMEPASQSQQFLVFHRILINIADKRPLAVISVTLNYRELNRIFGDLSDKSGEVLGLFNYENQLFYSNNDDVTDSQWKGLLARVDEQAGEAGYSEQSIERSLFLAQYNISGQNKWKLVKLTPIAELNKAAANARWINLVVGCGFLVFFIIVVIFVSNAITGRLKDFSRRIEQLGEGNFELDYEFKGRDEIAHLSRKFNQMVVRINDLIAERYEIKLNERNARLKALEAQINPHFLYNSLQAISTEAIIHEVDSIQQMVDALASSLRYCIKDGETVSVGHELEHIQNYLVLQKARFGERLQVAIDIPAEAMAILIPKMTLQILLENAIEHALEQMSEAIYIEIMADWDEQWLVLHVADDGPGMNAKRLEEVRAGMNENYLEVQEEIGLKNLYSRIKLMYGRDAHMTMNSQPGQGTDIQIRLPIRKEGQHVQSTDY
ncbi:sensor histidine kinase [Paenibacillus sedimenti]|uniref:histidine kinase n=1 Tax=Paenibacillus sedimenti TaxID=2770274 RepID=A0A926KW49_9BACL|nr:histidine kinase [Paenibacillus sedimenti]MBD0384256.1 histidine kinase [Paenibacillus sedimenti]